jgi:hypothetical protein
MRGRKEGEGGGRGEGEKGRGGDNFPLIENMATNQPV